MTARDLQEAEHVYQLAAQLCEMKREARNQAIHKAIAEGWTHARVAEATGLTRARVGQIALASR